MGQRFKPMTLTIAPQASLTQQLRQQLRRQRTGQPLAQQQALSAQMVQHLRRSSAWRKARHIALYLPVRGEADPRTLRQYALPHQRFYLPVLAPCRRGELWFVRWDNHTRFRLNRFRIPEPIANAAQQRAARALDLIITPLVGFDTTGTRMGMGGGFYDRTFAFKRIQRPYRQRPLLVGYAFAFQQVNNLKRQPWDVVLDAAVTESGLQYFRHKSGGRA